MDSLLFDGYTSYSDASTPRTPSPNDMSFNSSPSHLKPSLDLEAIKGIFDALHNDSIIHHSSQRPRQVPSKGSFMQELHGVSPVRLDMPHLDHHQNGRQYSSWTNVPGAAHSLQATLLSNQRFDPSTMRRNTFPYVRQDREDIFLGPKHDPSFPLRTDSLFSELLPIDGPHLSLGPDSHMDRPDQFHLFSSPTSPFRDFERLEGPGVKLEDRPPAILPSQAYMSPQQTASPSFLARYTGPHGIPIQHTDEASSKETQYLRRLCYNCRTTEPPSWRRSTLAPGKIVCNKCGLYERTHLRPRPLRFDELRAGTKSKKRRRAGSPKGLKILPPPGSMPIKKETKLTSRRLSAPSSGSTDGGSSDWDDSGMFNSALARSSAYINLQYSFALFSWISVPIWV